MLTEYVLYKKKDLLIGCSPKILIYFVYRKPKLHPEQLSEELLNINGYKSYFSSSIVKKGYSGVAIYTKQEPIKVEHGFGIPKFDDEGRIIIAHYKDFVLINIYYPNGKARAERLKYKMDFYDAFLEYANKLKIKRKKLSYLRRC